MKKVKLVIFFILVLSVIGLFTTSFLLFKNKINYIFGPKVIGVNLVLKAEKIINPVTQGQEIEKSNEDIQNTNKVVFKELELTKSVIERRINALGVSKSKVNIIPNNRINVYIPGYTDIEQVKQIIDRIALLTFKDENSNILITGKNLENATFEYQTIEEVGKKVPVIAIEWDDEGKKIFAEVTKENIGKTISIYLDDELLMSPNVNQEIKEGNAVITFGEPFGSLTLADITKQTKSYAALLKGGSLPVRISFLEEKLINPVQVKDEYEKPKRIIIIVFLIIIISMTIIYFLLHKYKSKQTQI